MTSEKSIKERTDIEKFRSKSIFIDNVLQKKDATVRYALEDVAKFTREDCEKEYKNELTKCTFCGRSNHLLCKCDVCFNKDNEEVRADERIKCEEELKEAKQLIIEMEQQRVQNEFKDKIEKGIHLIYDEEMITQSLENRIRADERSKVLKQLTELKNGISTFETLIEHDQFASILDEVRIKGMKDAEKKLIEKIEERKEELRKDYNNFNNETKHSESGTVYMNCINELKFLIETLKKGSDK